MFINTEHNKNSVMKMKILLLVAVFFLCIFTVNALTDVSINATSATNSIYPGKDAVFSVEITNTGTREDIFVLKLNEFIEDSDFAYEARITPSAMSIKNGQTGKFEIVVKTKIDARPNKNYKMKFAVRSSLDFDFNKAFELITRIYEPSKIIKIQIILIVKLIFYLPLFFIIVRHLGQVTASSRLVQSSLAKLSLRGVLAQSGDTSPLTDISLAL